MFLKFYCEVECPAKASSHSTLTDLSFTTLTAEARVLRDKLHRAVNGGFQSIIVEGNNTMVIQALKGLISIPWQIKSIIRDISKYLSLMDHFTASNIYSETNMTADWLAKVG